jgi:hypothetical protein
MELQPQRTPPASPPKPPPPVSPDIPTLASAEVMPATAGSSSQTPAHLRLQQVDQDNEARMSTGSQFTEHFGDVPSDYARGPRQKSPLGDKPFPHIPFHPLPPTQGGVVQSKKPEPQLSFVPFDGNANRTAASSSSGRKDSTSPKNSLPPGAASPVESVGSHKPGEQSHSKEVSI